MTLINAIRPKRSDPSPFIWQDDPALVAHLEKVAAAERARTTTAEALATAERVLAEAREAEAAVLVANAPAAEARKARKRVEEAEHGHRVAEAKAGAAQREHDRLAAETDAVETAARASARARIRAAYALGVDELERRLVEASEAAEVVYTLHEVWGEQAGLTLVRWPELALRGQRAHAGLLGSPTNESKLQFLMSEPVLRGLE